MSSHFRWVALGSTVAALVVIGVLTYQRVSQLIENDRESARARDVISAAYAALALAGDAEGAYRGYLLSGDDQELTAYRSARDLLDGRLADLNSLAAHDPAQAARVAELRSVADAAGALRVGVMEVSENGGSPAPSLERQREGRALDRRMREVADELIGVELDTLSAWQAGAAARSLAARQLIVAAFLMAVATSIFAGIRIRTELMRRRAAEESVRGAYAEAEERIQVRTRELVEATNRIRSSEEQFRAIAEVSPVHLFATAADGAIVYGSPGFQSLTGIPAEQTMGLGWTAMLHPDDRAAFIAHWQDAIRSGQAFHSEVRFRDAGGDHRWFKVHLVPVPGESGVVDRWVGAAADVHEQHQALEARALALERERQAREASERVSQLKDDFLATISHELRTPLNAIVGWAHVLHANVLPAADTRRAVEAIERNARAQARAIDDLLDVSGLIQGGLTLSVAPCDLRYVVRGVVDTVEPSASAKGMSIDMTSNSDDVRVMGDEARLRQIVWNLLSNAVKFTHSAGRVSLDLVRAGDRVCLRVADSGEGIDPAFLPHVFDAFRQGPSRSMRAGLGLGLAIVHELVALHGGSIVAESAGMERGATFTVSLPAYVPRTPLAKTAIA